LGTTVSSAPVEASERIRGFRELNRSVTPEMGNVCWGSTRGPWARGEVRRSVRSGCCCGQECPRSARVRAWAKCPTIFTGW
jgi:hypothetical protein